MLAYWIGGDNYNQILIDIRKSSSGAPVVEQYYVQFGRIVKRSNVIYTLTYDDGISLAHINTDDTDTVVLPRNGFKSVSQFAVSGCLFQRLVVPLNMDVHFKNKSLYGSDTLCDFLSLSRRVTYDGDVFPETVTRRVY